MRANGEGSVQALPNGKFRGTVRLPGGKRFFGPSVEKRARALPAMWQKLRQQGEAPDEPALSICVNRRIDEMISSSYSPTTIDLWRAALRRIEGDVIGDLTPSQVDAAELTAWISRQAGSPRTIKNYTDVIRFLVRQYGHELKAPEARSSGAARRPKRLPKLLSITDQKELLALDMPPSTRLMVLLGLRQGLRRSEMAGLRHDDREGAGIWIRRAVVRSLGQVTIKNTKTESSEAWLPLAPELVDLIGQGEGYVLGGAEPPSPSVLDDRWRRLVAKHPRFQGVRLHDLRRSFGMTLLESGTDVRTTAELMRHDPVMLLKLYSRSRRDLKTKAFERAFG